MSKERELLQQALASLKALGRDEGLQEAIKEELAKPEQEPIGFVNPNMLRDYLKETGRASMACAKGLSRENYSVPLYSSPQKQSPLSESEIIDLIPIIQNGWRKEDFAIWLARAIEKAHKIGSDNE